MHDDVTQYIQIFAPVHHISREEHHIHHNNHFSVRLRSCRRLGSDNAPQRQQRHRGDIETWPGMSTSTVLVQGARTASVHPGQRLSYSTSSSLQPRSVAQVAIVRNHLPYSLIPGSIQLKNCLFVQMFDGWYYHMSRGGEVHRTGYSDPSPPSPALRFKIHAEKQSMSSTRPDYVRPGKIMYNMLPAW